MAIKTKSLQRGKRKRRTVVAESETRCGLVTGINPKRERKAVKIAFTKLVRIPTEIAGENELRVRTDSKQHDEANWVL